MSGNNREQNRGQLRVIHGGADYSANANFGLNMRDEGNDGEIKDSIRSDIQSQEVEQPKWISDMSIDEVVQRAIAEINSVDPQFLRRNRLNLLDVENRINRMYGSVPELVARYGDRSADRIAYSFKVYLNHIRFLLTEHPEINDDLEDALSKVRDVLKGKYRPEAFVTRKNQNVIEVNAIQLNSIAIPNIFEVRPEQHPLFSSFESVKDIVSKALPFVNDREVQKVVLMIFNSGSDSESRAEASQAIVVSYLQEARTLVLNTTVTLPKYYNPDSNVTKVIEQARNGLLY